MDTLETVRNLVGQGRFSQALETLPNITVAYRDRFSAEVLRAELLEKSGQHDASRAILLRLGRTRGLSQRDRSACEFISSFIARDAGDVEAARLHLQRAVSFAVAAPDLELTSLAQLRLASIIADQSGPEAISPLFAEARGNAIKLGNPHVTAALHLVVGELDAKRGFLTSAVRHTRLAQELVASTSNLWLDAWAENNLLALCLVRSEFEQAALHGDRVLELSLLRRICG